MRGSVVRYREEEEGGLTATGEVGMEAELVVISLLWRVLDDGWLG